MRPSSDRDAAGRALPKLPEPEPSSTHVVLPYGYVREPYHAALAVLELALQAATEAVRTRDAVLNLDPSAPKDDRSPTEKELEEALVAGAQALLQLLRCYRAVQDELPF